MTAEINLNNVTTTIAEVAANLAPIGKKVKMDVGFSAPIIYDGTVTPAKVDNVDRETDTTIRMDHATFLALSQGQTTGPAAMMAGKLKITGDMGAAMAFQGIMDRVQKAYKGG